MEINTDNTRVDVRKVKQHEDPIEQLRHFPHNKREWGIVIKDSNRATHYIIYGRDNRYYTVYTQYDSGKQPQMNAFHPDKMDEWMMPYRRKRSKEKPVGCAFVPVDAMPFFGDGRFRPEQIFNQVAINTTTEYTQQ